MLWIIVPIVILVLLALLAIGGDRKRRSQPHDGRHTGEDPVRTRWTNQGKGEYWRGDGPGNPGGGAGGYQGGGVG
jgi:hypothetical protein